jgi:hypothetical protein
MKNDKDYEDAITILKDHFDVAYDFGEDMGDWPTYTTPMDDKWLDELIENLCKSSPYLEAFNELFGKPKT